MDEQRRLLLQQRAIEALREIGHRRLPALWGGIVLHWRAAQYSWALQRMMDTDIDQTLVAEEA